MSHLYDVIIIGGGPCGLSAALYAARGGKKTALIEKAAGGGQISTTSTVDNYPGGILEESGMQLSARMKEQAEHFGTIFISDEIKSASLEGKKKKVMGVNAAYEGRAVIICTGAAPNTLGCPGEAEFKGRGVSYCATCDGVFFTGQTVIVVGGGEAALEESEFLTRFAKEVILVHRRDQFTASAHAQEKVRGNKKIKTIMETIVEEIKGGDTIQEVVLRNLKTGEKTVYQADGQEHFIGVFIFVGYKPSSKLFEDSVDTNGAGYFITDENMRTNLPGVFAAGDVREKQLRQAITAAADGAVAGVEAIKFIDTNFKNR